MIKTPENLAIIGKITGVYGIKGWVKIHSDTQPMENIFSYGDWQVCMNGQWTTVKVRSWRPHGKGIVAALDDCQDRTLAQKYCQCEVAVPKEVLPSGENGEFYYHQLEKLLVVTTDNVVLGRIDHMFNTGSNDVMVVKPCKESIDGRERWVPYADQYLQEISLEDGVVKVDWDPEF